MFKEYRVNKKITQEQLANQTGLDTRTIQRIESGERNPSIDTLNKLRIALDITDEDILNYIKSFKLEKK